LVNEFPANQRYYQRLKNVLRNAARYNDLLQVIENHLIQNPNDIQSLVELGNVQLALGRKDQALSIWESILSRFPGNLMAQRLVLTHLFTNNLADEGSGLLNRLREDRNNPSFFALEMGRLHAARLNYDDAIDEFLLHLSSQPQAINNITGQLLGFPAEPEILAMFREKLTGYGSPEATRILASVEFKHRNFSRVVELYRQMNASPQELLQIGLDLMAESEWDLTQQLMEQRLADPEAVPQYEQAIMTLASIYEARSIADQVHFPLSGFYQDSRFFVLPFIRVDEPQLNSLRQAMTLYDSLITTWRNPRARLRLGDIKYLILDDFDGAINDFEGVIMNRSAGRFHPPALLRMVDLWIAKGNLEAAAEACRQAEARLKTTDQLNRVEVKAVELLLLSGDRDSLLVYVGGQLAALGPADPYFNDLMELQRLVLRFEDWPAQYEAFVQSEFLLRQNRRSEAIALLAASLEDELTPVSPILQYRLAHLHALQGNHGEAEGLSLAIPGTSEFSELGLLLAAELADYLLGNTTAASTRYLSFLDAYPLSVHSDAVRLRYRALNPEVD
ncbi:MAG: tetratricopeptide repeat protein, partial [Fidelibacterota bacterium]